MQARRVRGECIRVRLNGAWLAGISSAEKAWVGRKTKVALSAETHGASSNQRQTHEAGAQGGGKKKTTHLTIKVSATGRVYSLDSRSLFRLGKLILKWDCKSESDNRWIPRSYLHLEVRSSTGAEEIQEVLSGLTFWVISNQQRCLRVMWTLIHTEIHSLRTSSEHYYRYCCGVQELSSTLIPIISSAV